MYRLLGLVAWPILKRIAPPIARKLRARMSREKSAGGALMSRSRRDRARRLPVAARRGRSPSTSPAKRGATGRPS